MMLHVHLIMKDGIPLPSGGNPHATLFNFTVEYLAQRKRRYHRNNVGISS